MQIIEPAMRGIEILAALSSLALLVIGYRKNQRRMMAVAGIGMMVAGAAGHVADKLDHQTTTVQLSAVSRPGT